MRPLTLLGVTAFLLVCGASYSLAQAPAPNASDAPAPRDWQASAQAGLLLSTGNASTSSLSGGLRAGHRSGANRYELKLAGAFARSAIYLASDENDDGTIDPTEVERITSTTTQSWLARTRYERLLAGRNAIYASTSLAADKPAGKRLVGSGQLGYSRNLVETREHRIAAESGYDFSYERLSVDDKGLKIHSLRAFIGYEGTLSPDTRLLLSGEILANLNRIQTPRGPIEQLKDTRFNSEVSLSTAVNQTLSFRFAFIARYDNRPAPRPELGLPYSADFLPLADRLDTRTEATLIIDFL